MAQGAAGEVIQQAVGQTIVRRVNRLLRYEAFINNGVAYQLQAQKHRTITDSQRKALRQGAASGELAVDNLADQAEQLSLDTCGGDVLDLGLAPVEGPYRSDISLCELKQAARMLWVCSRPIHKPECLEGKRLILRRNGTEVDAPCLTYVWNHPELEQKGEALASLFKNVKGLMSQVARYCGPRGIQYALVSNYLYSWAIKMEGADFFVSQAFPYNATGPSVTAMVYYICRMAIDHAPKMEPWLPASAPETPEAGDGAGASKKRGGSGRGGSSGTGGGGGGAGIGSASRGLQPSAQVAGSSGSQRAHCSSKTASTVEFSGGAVDVSLTEDQQYEQPLPSWQHFERSRCAAAPPSTVVRGELEAAAAALDVQKVLGVIGEGISGLVFSYRTPCGGLLALKVAPLDSPKAAALLEEVQVMVALRAHWDVHLPRLVAAGAECKDRGFVAATRSIKGRHLNPRTDQHLRPQLEAALAAAHACGVAHGDLRESNVLVEVEAGGGQRAWLIDWGNATLCATQQEKQRDLTALNGLFVTAARISGHR